MCLSVVKENYRKPYKDTGLGYKIFEENSKGQLKFQYYPNRDLDHGKRPNSQTMIAPRGRWIKSIEVRVLAGNGAKRYRSGFHLYLDKARTEGMAGVEFLGGTTKTVTVRWRGLKAVGLQGNMEVMVVDEIFIPRGSK